MATGVMLLETGVILNKQHPQRRVAARRGPAAVSGFGVIDHGGNAS
jgi:hypothetical protein